MKEFLRRSAWAFMAGLFIVTGLGVGILSFWQNTHPTVDKGLACKSGSGIHFNTEANGKLEGAKLADFTSVAHVDSLTCYDIKVGNGTVVQSTSSVTANYTGALAATGVIFQSSLDSGQPFTTALTGVIPGWQKGLIGMKAGGERRLVIPSSLAYGSQATSGIPANSDLVFDISVSAVQ